MPISVSCPSCGRQYNVKDEAAGKKFKCKDCETIVEVPGGGVDPAGSESGGEFEEDNPFGNLDFGGPATTEAALPRRRPSVAGSSGRSGDLSRLSGPAVGMMITAGIGILFNLGVGAFLVIAMIAAPAGAQGGADAIVGIIINGAAMLFGMVMLILVMYGAIKMKNGESYGLAMAASIIAAIPCLSPCICMPFGIWGIVVLSDSDVKDAFR